MAPRNITSPQTISCTVFVSHTTGLTKYSMVKGVSRRKISKQNRAKKYSKSSLRRGRRFDGVLSSVHFVNRFQVVNALFQVLLRCRRHKHWINGRYKQTKNILKPLQNKIPSEIRLIIILLFNEEIPFPTCVMNFFFRFHNGIECGRR